MRLLLVLATALVLSASLAGCLERRGTLAVNLEVSDSPAMREFRSIPFALYRVQVDARSLNPQPFPSDVTNLDLVQAAASGERMPVFRQEVRSDRYTKVTLTVPPGLTFTGTLLNGTTVGIVVPNNALVLQPDLEVPRGGEASYLFAIRLDKVQSGGAGPVYQVVPDRDASGPR